MSVYRLTVTGSRRDVRTLEEGEFTAAQLAAHFSTYEIGEKDGEAVIPAVFNVCPEPCRNAGKGITLADGTRKEALNCGGGNWHRLGANVAAMTMLGADLDDLPTAEFHRVLEGLRTAGLAFWWWHTYSHDPASTMVRGRVLIPFASPLPLQNAKQWSRIAWPALMRHVGLPMAADPSCRDPARVYYLPRKPSAEAVRGAGFHEGRDLDWRAVLGDSLEKAVVAEGNITPAAPEDPTRPVDLADFRERLSRVRTENKTLITRLLRGDALTSPPGERKPGEVSRYVAWLRVTGAIAARAHDWECTETLLELCRPSWAAEVQDSPSDHTEWETVEQLLETARAGMPALRAQREAERAASREVFLRALDARRRADGRGGGGREGGGGPGPPAGPEGLSGRAEDAEGDSAASGEPESADVGDRGPAGSDAPSQSESGVPAWTRLLILNPPMKDQPPTLKNCAANVAIILENDPEWRGALRYNELTKMVEDWRSGEPRPLADADAVHVATWLAQVHGLHMGDNIVWARLLAAARANAYDPLAQYLDPLQWDGAERLATMLSVYFGAEDTPFARLAGKRWMVSAAARGLAPGTQVDSVLVLEGPQGTGKTSAGRILGGSFFVSAAIDFHSKDSLLIVSQAWICELGELDSLRRSETTAQKQFLSSSADDFRPPYGRVTERFPRRCVFLGTSNTDDYLQDESGNRRWWPVVAGTIDTKALARDRDQLWAEAVAVYRAAEECTECRGSKRGRCGAHRWWMEDEERELVAAETEKRMAADSVADAVEEWILKKEPAARPLILRTLDIVTDVLKEQPSRGLEMRISKALRRLGFVKWRDAKVRGYRLPDSLRTAPRRAEKSVAQRMAEATTGVKA